MNNEEFFKELIKQTELIGEVKGELSTITNELSNQKEEATEVKKRVASLEKSDRLLKVAWLVVAGWFGVDKIA